MNRNSNLVTGTFEGAVVEPGTFHSCGFPDQLFDELERKAIAAKANAAASEAPESSSSPAAASTGGERPLTLPPQK